MHVRSGSGRYRPHGGGSAFALRNIATERATTLVASRALVFATADGTTVRQLAPREAAALMGLPATMALPDTVRDATAVLGNGIEAHTARALVAAAREALAEECARTTGGSDGGLTAAAREARRRLAGAAEAHVAWWRARTRKRRLVVERAARPTAWRAPRCCASSTSWGRQRAAPGAPAVRGGFGMLTGEKKTKRNVRKPSVSAFFPTVTRGNTR